MSLVLATLLSFLILYYWYDISKKYQYWEVRKVPHLKPSWPFGTLKKLILLKQYQGFASVEHCSYFPNAPYVGGYLGTTPVLFVTDPEYVKIVLVKAFAYMSGRSNTKYTKREILTRFIFFAGDDDWKVLRQNVAPLYSSGKVKNMFPLIKEINDNFEKKLNEETAITPETNIREVMGRYTMDCITSCAFGVDSNMIRNYSPSNPFVKVTESVFCTSIIQSAGLMISQFFPSIFYGFGLKLFPTWMYKFFTKVLNDVFEKRQYKPSNRHDFIDLIFSLKDQVYMKSDSLSSARTGEKKAIKTKVDDEVLLAQCIGIFAAGYETSATAMTYTCYFIARDEKIQALVHQEVDQYFERHNGKLGYEVVTELPYVEACLEESLRMCPVGSNIRREVLYDYTFPDGLKVDAGTIIFVPVYYIHHCSKYYPEPEVFRPERFLGEEKQKIKTFTNLSFGEGPRQCLGERFSKLQVMVGFATLFKNFKLEFSEKTPQELMFSTKGLLLVLEKDLYLKVVPRNK